MKNALLALLLLLSFRGEAGCEGIPLHSGVQIGLGVQNFIPGNQKDFSLVAPSYSLTTGYAWGHYGVYVSGQYASSTNFSLVATEASLRYVVETPFVNGYGQAGVFWMNYGTATSIRHNLGGGLGSVGLMLLFSTEVEFDFFLKGYLLTESFLAAGGTFLFRL